MPQTEGGLVGWTLVNLSSGLYAVKQSQIVQETCELPTEKQVETQHCHCRLILLSFPLMLHHQMETEVNIHTNLCSQFRCDYMAMWLPLYWSQAAGTERKSCTSGAWSTLQRVPPLNKPYEANCFREKVNGWLWAFQIPSHISHLCIFTLRNQQFPPRKRQNKGTHDCLGKSKSFDFMTFSPGSGRSRSSALLQERTCFESVVFPLPARPVKTIYS